MNILIPNSWLRKYLSTDAKPKAIAETLTLCGPTVDKLIKIDNDFVYEIEITTNRVDLMSVFGIAREACAILPQFGFKAKLKSLKLPPITSQKDLDIRIVDKQQLSKRTLAIKLSNVNLKSSPHWMKDALTKVGQRPLLNAIDITNYVMWEMGHPIHVFDYDQIKEKLIVIRSATKGEKITTLDNKTHTLKGGEIVFDDGKGVIIDLPGIMGAKNSVVTQNTKNVLLWIESLDPKNIRSASMDLNLRSQAAILNEKKVDPESAYPTLLRAIELFENICNAKQDSKIVDIYPKKINTKKITVKLEFINQKLGVTMNTTQVKKILEQLGLNVSSKKDVITVGIPSYRADDISQAEDLVEEVARIYGYHRLPSTLMSGQLPSKPNDSPFQFEFKIKNILKTLKASEIYTISLVPEDEDHKAIKLSNPLGSEMEYLRTSLYSSLSLAAANNSGYINPFHLFEMANIYLPNNNNLPKEIMMLSGIFSDYSYRKAKGVIETFLSQLNIKYSFLTEDKKHFLPLHRLVVKGNNKYLGEFGTLENNYIYYEFGIEALRREAKSINRYKPTSKYPAQIEDLTFTFPDKTKIGEIIENISQEKFVSKVKLTTIYKDNYTFRIFYQHPTKTFSDNEVEKLRLQIIKIVKESFGGKMKV